MEAYKKEAAESIRATGASLSFLPDRTLCELWGRYSCQSGNCFWLSCVPEEISRFVAWTDGLLAVQEVIAQARRKRFHIQKHPADDGRRPASKRYIQGWDGQRIADPRLREGSARPPKIPHAHPALLMTVHQLIRMVNQWCDDNQIVPVSQGCKRKVDERMIRYCCQWSLLDPPGSPADGRQRGFSEKHACQLRTIRLLQARSLSYKAINYILHDRSVEQLREIEHDELRMMRGDFSGFPGSAIMLRQGAPKWA